MPDRSLPTVAAVGFLVAAVAAGPGLVQGDGPTDPAPQARESEIPGFIRVDPGHRTEPSRARPAAEPSEEPSERSEQAQPASPSDPSEDTARSRDDTEDDEQAESEEAQWLKEELQERQSRQLLGYLAHEEPAWRRAARTLLVERADPEVVDPLRSMALNGRHIHQRIEALRTLSEMGKADQSAILGALRDPDEEVQVEAVRVAADWLVSQAEPPQRLVEELIRLAGRIGPPEEEESEDALTLEQRRHTARALGAVRGEQEAEAQRILAGRLADWSADGRLRSRTLEALEGTEDTFLGRLLELEVWQEQTEPRKLLLTELGEAVGLRGEAATIDAVLARVAEDPAGELRWRDLALLTGLRGAAGRGEAQRLRLEAPLRQLDRLEQATDTDVRELAAALAERLEVDEAVAGAVEELEELEEAGDAADTEEQGAVGAAVMEQGRAVYMATCMSCHQLHGGGLPGMAPPIVDSKWVTGSKEALVRIVLHGIHGSTDARGRQWEQPMPGLHENPVLNDERMASLLTYIRRSWGHEATAVDEETVRQVRRETADRVEPWSVEELEALLEQP